MNAVGIDVSKNKSMVAVARPFGQIVVKPFEVRHTAIELKKQADLLKSLDGETRVVMEHTGRYYEPVAQYIHGSGVFVSAVNPLLIREYGNNSLRRVKTDKTDSPQIARYALDNWAERLKSGGFQVALRPPRLKLKFEPWRLKAIYSHGYRKIRVKNPEPAV